MLSDFLGDLDAKMLPYAINQNPALRFSPIAVDELAPWSKRELWVAQGAKPLYFTHVRHVA